MAGKMEKGITIPDQLAVISFNSQQELFEEELEKDESDYLDYQDPGTLSRDFLQNIEQHTELLEKFEFIPLLDKGYKQLSTGQSRKLLVLQAIISGARWLVIENPYDGLDTRSCEELSTILSHVAGQGRSVILCVNNVGDIPDWIENLGFFSDQELVLQGARNNILPQIEKRFLGSSCILNTDELDEYSVADDSQPIDKVLVELKDGFAGYNGKRIFEDLNLNITEGKHTLVTGSNGSGKSTLLQIISGDNPKCYANSLILFGKKRGSGESIWDLKEKMGLVSPDLHRNYRVSIKVLQVVISGLYDSIGLYKNYTQADVKKAEFWLKQIGLTEKAATPFPLLPFAEQRLVLIARALIKMPPLLVLDEPTQGLDEANRKRLLDFLEHLAEKELSTILYVSHRQDEYREFFTQHLCLDDYAVSYCKGEH